MIESVWFFSQPPINSPCDEPPPSPHFHTLFHAPASNILFNDLVLKVIIIIYFLVKIYILQLDWPADSYASLGGPVDQWLQAFRSQLQHLHFNGQGKHIGNVLTSTLDQAIAYYYQN